MFHLSPLQLQAREETGEAATSAGRAGLRALDGAPGRLLRLGPRAARSGRCFGLFGPKGDRWHGNGEWKHTPWHGWDGWDDDGDDDGMMMGMMGVWGWISSFLDGDRWGWCCEKGADGTFGSTGGRGGLDG